MLEQDLARNLQAVSPGFPRFAVDAAHLARQRHFSVKTFGPGERTKGVVEHIRSELDEILADPADVSEWVDVIILAFDGALRQGHEPQAILDALLAKQSRNESRVWPDWRERSEDEPIEHVRGGADEQSGAAVEPEEPQFLVATDLVKVAREYATSDVGEGDAS